MRSGGMSRAGWGSASAPPRRAIRFLDAVRASSRILPGQFTMKPRASQSPIPPHRTHGYVEHLGCFFQTQARKETEFDHLALPWIERRKSRQRFIDCNQVPIRLRRDDD